MIAAQINERDQNPTTVVRKNPVLSNQLPLLEPCGSMRAWSPYCESQPV